jgi:hypothetical protein
VAAGVTTSKKIYFKKKFFFYWLGPEVLAGSSRSYFLFWLLLCAYMYNIQGFVCSSPPVYTVSPSLGDLPIMWRRSTGLLDTA